MKQEQRDRIDNILYAPIGWLMHLMALLPLGALYVVSDCLRFIVYNVAHYRVGTVRKNLAESFPDKSVAELRDIERRFYRRLCDYFIETIKLLHISDDEMRRRCIMEGVERVNEAFDRGHSIVIYAAHFANWEWLTSIALWSPQNQSRIMGQIYQKLDNRWMDRFFLRLRDRFNTVCVEKHNTLRSLLQLRKEGKLSIIGFISDQHPLHNEGNHTVRFLNHDTAFMSGPETIARRFGMEVMIFDMIPLRRGYYKVTIREVSRDAAAEQPNALTDAFVQWLEMRINRYPDQWLWTHKRWKRPVTAKPEAPTPLINPVDYNE